MEIDDFIKGLEALSSLDRDMQLSTALTFLYAGKNEGQHQLQLEERTGFSNAAVSRNVAYWSRWKRHKIAGHDMLQTVIDPADRRFRLVTLTPKGRTFINRLEEIISHGSKTRKEMAGKASDTSEVLSPDFQHPRRG